MRPESTAETPLIQDCNCLALRQAARYVTQHYDQYLASTGLRATQFSVLADLNRHGPMTVNQLAAMLVMDRTTLGHSILPLQRAGLIETATGQNDRRRKELRVTALGQERLATATTAWADAQESFERAFGEMRSQELRGLLRALVGTELRGTS